MLGFPSMVLALALATPPPAPPAMGVASAAVLRAADDVERRTPAKDTATRETIARIKKVAKDPLTTSTALWGVADEVATLQPDVENVHIATLDAMLALAPLEKEPRALHTRIRTRATEFVQRNPALSAGHLMLAGALAALGDEEGQLRALFVCGEKCRAPFLVAATKWQRVRCSGAGIAPGLALHLGTEIVAGAHEVSFLEPIAAVPGVPATTTLPAVPETPAQCLMQLAPSAGGRLPARDIAGPPPAGLFVVNGIALVSDTLRPGVIPGSLIGPAVLCERLCKKFAPRALPDGVTTTPVVPAAAPSAPRPARVPAAAAAPSAPPAAPAAPAAPARPAAAKPKPATP